MFHYFIESAAGKKLIKKLSNQNKTEIFILKFCEIVILSVKMSNENYHVSRKNTGLGMFLTQNESTTWEGSAQDYEPTVSDKDYYSQSQSFYCEVCDIDCTSENQYEAHVNGKNHFKRLKLQGKVHIDTLGLVSAQTRLDF